MKEITVVIPVHEWSDSIKDMFSNAVNSVLENKKTYSGTLNILVAKAESIKEKISDFDEVVISGDTDYCSMINNAVEHIKTPFFSILEFDDKYKHNWFAMAERYYNTNEMVGVFLPINELYDKNGKFFAYLNEAALASSFSKELGFVDYESLDNFSMFNLTGAVINTEDFIEAGKFKPSIKVAFNYEFLLRFTKNEGKVMVVPKIGYEHNIGRENSLTDIYEKEIDNKQISAWFELAKRECSFKEDRKKDVSETKQVELK